VTWILDVPLVPPSLNEWQRMCWRDRIPFTEEWDRAIWALCLEQHVPQLERIDLNIEIYFKDKRRRDYDNQATAFKLSLDALVHAGILPDDNPRHLVRPMFPAILCDRKYPHTEITIVPRQ